MLPLLQGAWEAAEVWEGWSLIPGPAPVPRDGRQGPGHDALATTPCGWVQEGWGTAAAIEQCLTLGRPCGARAVSVLRFLAAALSRRGLTFLKILSYYHSKNAVV